jgi:hypothetical protein
LRASFFLFWTTIYTSGLLGTLVLGWEYSTFLIFLFAWQVIGWGQAALQVGWPRILMTGQGVLFTNLVLCFQLNLTAVPYLGDFRECIL